VHPYFVVISDVDVSRQKIYFALKLETSELRSVSLGGDGDLFDKTIERRVDDEFMNGLYAHRLICWFTAKWPLFS